MATTIAIFNQAGGVGKTTLTQNLGYHLSAAGKKVLMVDLDSQASLTTFVGLNSDSIDETITQSLIDKKPLPKISLFSNLDIVPSNRNLRKAETQLVGEMAREMRLKRLLEPIQPQFDFILIDCPPSLTLLPILGLTAADYLLVPIQTHPKAFWGTDQLLTTVMEVQESTNPNLALAGIVPTLYEKRNRQDKEILSAIRQQLGQVSEVMKPIPKTIAFPEATSAHIPLIQCKKKSEVIDDALSALNFLTKKVLSWSTPYVVPSLSDKENVLAHV